MSLNINKEIGDEIKIALEGRLDTTSAPDLETELDELTKQKKPLILDLTGLDYISSAGLRVLLKAQKAVNADGNTMKLTNVNTIIMEIFDITGFSDILTIEK